MVMVLRSYRYRRVLLELFNVVLDIIFSMVSIFASVLYGAASAVWNGKNKQDNVS